MFRKLVAIEPLNVKPEQLDGLKRHAQEIEFYKDKPADEAEVIRRMQGADAVLVGYTTPISAAALAACRPTLRYVGMCCSLYTPESANVDILAARELGIVVKGVLDYGDEGVPEYVISELVRFLHGFGDRMWRNEPTELTDIPIGILGMGTTGQVVGRALRFFGARVFYYSRTRKPAVESTEGFVWSELTPLLQQVDIVCTCLNKNVILLGEEQLRVFTGNKILVNTSIGPGHDVQALGVWLDQGNYAFSDTPAGLDPQGLLAKHANAFVGNKPAGKSVQSAVRLGKKVLENIQDFEAGR